VVITVGTLFLRSSILQVCRGYGVPHGDPYGYGYGDRNSIPTAALDSAVGIGSPWGSLWVWLWGGYGDRNSIPTAALDSALGMVIPMGIPVGMGGYGDRN